MPAMAALVDISAELSARVEELDFPSVPFVYNPLVYARIPHETVPSPAIRLSSSALDVR